MTPEGRIITFYSFKGGVGRTMTVANVAFLAALNGHRVLVMDWDLEAPGLAYYFRGLLDGQATKALRECPGVLDLVWEWTATVKSNSEDALREAVSRYQSGQAFDACVYELDAQLELPTEAALHYIGPGRRMIPTPEPIAYEDALSRFSWQHFFDECAGGAVLDSLRRWARTNYDYVLIDSRTGLADVAGICTMQIPDQVVLCFVLNRQNIDGVAKVAAAIRSKRADQVPLRAMPMRVARQNTSEESDARARAITELTRIGAFTQEAVLDNFKLLSISAAENVPFYETLAPFVAADPSLDLLTLNYLRAGSHLLGVELEPPKLNSDLVELARRRLQPAHATVEYVSTLLSGEPARAMHELQRLLESAYEAQTDGTLLDEAYVTALVQAAFSMSPHAGGSFELLQVQGQALDLLRALMATSPNKWETSLGAYLEQYLERSPGYLDGEEELAVLEEIESILSHAPTIVTYLKRVGYRRRVARLHLLNENAESTYATIAELGSLIRQLRKDSSALGPDQLEDVVVAEADVHLIKGELAVTKEAWTHAREEFESGLRRLQILETTATRSEKPRLEFDLRRRIALLPTEAIDSHEAARHATSAYRALHTTALGSAILQVTRLGRVVLRTGDADLVSHYVQASLGAVDRNGKVQLANFLARQPRAAGDFFLFVSDVVSLLGRSEAAPTTARHLAEVCELTLRQMKRRSGIQKRRLDIHGAQVTELFRRFTDLGVDVDVEEWVSAAEFLKSSQSEASRGRS